MKSNSDIVNILKYESMSKNTVNQHNHIAFMGDLSKKQSCLLQAKGQREKRSGT